MTTHHYYFGEESDPLRPEGEPLTEEERMPPALQCGKRTGVSDTCVLAPGHAGDCWSLDQILEREG